MKAIRKILNLTEGLLEYVSMALLIIMIIIVFCSVVTRYIFKFTPMWSEEVTTFLMIWFGFLSVAIGVKRGTHLTIGALVEVFPKKLRFLVYIFDELCVGLYGVLAAMYGATLVSDTMSSMLPATQWPSGTEYLVFPIAGVMIVIYALGRILDIILNKNLD